MNRKTMTKIMVAAAAMLITFTATGMAQCHERLTVDIPFAFRANGSDLPAGEYRTEPNYAPGVVLMKATEGKPGIFIRCDSARAVRDKASQYGLTFTKVGSTYLLTSIWEGNQESTVHLPKGDTKMLIEAGNAGPTTTRTILARR